MGTHGGARPGAGRKPKDRALAKLQGSRQRSVVRFPDRVGAVPVAPAAPPIPVDVVCPEDLPDAAKVVWARLAPHAVAACTLTVGTADAFALLCRQVVLERSLSESRDAGLASHRGMMQRVEAGLVRFSLAPMGKPLAPKVEAVVDPFAEFEAAQ